jgi:hypothetical protein
MRTLTEVQITSNTRLSELNTSMATLATQLSELAEQEKIAQQIANLQTQLSASVGNQDKLEEAYKVKWEKAADVFIQDFLNSSWGQSAEDNRKVASFGLDRISAIDYINKLKLGGKGFEYQLDFANPLDITNSILSDDKNRDGYAWVAGEYSKAPNKAALDLLGTLRTESLAIEKLREQIRALGGIPQFAVGTNYVPEDMTARIHKGERIIPAADNTALMDALTSPARRDAVLVEEIRLLRAEIAAMKAGTDSTAKHTAKTARLLDRVMPDGDALSVRTAT